MSTFPMNSNNFKFNMFGRYFLQSILTIFNSPLLHFLRLAFDEHLVSDFELLDCIHFHYTLI
jgi:hypothetical protein